MLFKTGWKRHQLTHGLRLTAQQIDASRSDFYAVLKMSLAIPKSSREVIAKYMAPEC